MIAPPFERLQAMSWLEWLSMTVRQQHPVWLEDRLHRARRRHVLVFYAAGIGRQIESLGPGAFAPVSAKIIAGTSLFLRVAVIYMGRMLPYIGNSF